MTVGAGYHVFDPILAYSNLFAKLQRDYLKKKNKMQEAKELSLTKLNLNKEGSLGDEKTFQHKSLLSGIETVRY